MSRVEERVLPDSELVRVRCIDVVRLIRGED